MSGHTPGPWTADTQTDRADVRAPDGGHLCAIYSRLDLPGLHPAVKATRDANARLIAAAPDLLEALKKIHKYADGFIALGLAGDFFLAWDAKAKAAIAKAEYGNSHSQANQGVAE